MKKQNDQKQTPVRRINSHELARKEFVKRTSSYSHKTKNVCISHDWDYSGVSSVDKSVRLGFPAIMELLQDNINGGHNNALCQKNQFLLIYNFQPLYKNDEGGTYCSIDMLVKPTEDDSRDLSIKSQEKKYPQLGLVVSPEGEVMNESLFFQQAYPDDYELQEEQVPTSYGFYSKYMDMITHKETKEKTESKQNQDIQNDGLMLPFYALTLNDTDTDTKKNNKEPQKSNVRNTNSVLK